jgi:hypothetical protein
LVHPTKTVGQALVDNTWNGIGGFARDADVKKALFTASLKIGAMELNRPEDLEYNPIGAPRLYVAFTNHAGTVALDQQGVLIPAATTQPNRGDRAGGIFAIEEASAATPASSMTFEYWQVWSGSLQGGLFDAGSPIPGARRQRWPVVRHRRLFRVVGAPVGRRALLPRPRSSTQDDVDADVRARLPHRGSSERLRGDRSGIHARNGNVLFNVQHPGEDVLSSWPAR